MYEIAICIPTYKRPLMLERLVLSIVECNINRSILKTINIIIVDNDREKSAELTSSKLLEQNNKILHISYFNYPVPGLSNVRNELLRKAFSLAADFIVFIDDDEYVTQNWLNELVQAISINKADAVRGPVVSVIESTIPKYISCWFERERYANNTQLSTLTTGNLILRCSSLKKFNVWFDPRFNSSGSEDGYFGVQLLNKGGEIYWAGDAIAYETIPKSRANLRWLFKRNLRTASTFSYVLILEKNFLLLLRKLLVSIVYLFLGSIMSILIFTNYRKKYWGILKIAEGCGGIIGAFRITYKEYKTYERQLSLRY